MLAIMYSYGQYIQTMKNVNLVALPRRCRSWVCMEEVLNGIVTITTENAPSPLGHYVQAARAASLIHISGQLPIVAGGVANNQSAPFEAQAKLVIQNFLAIVAAAGAGPERVIKVTAYIVGSSNWPAFNHAFAEAFGDHRPGRSVVPVPELHHGYLIEIDGIAVDMA